jgi:hypothetical protein
MLPPVALQDLPEEGLVGKCRRYREAMLQERIRWYTMNLRLCLPLMPSALPQSFRAADL